MPFLPLYDTNPRVYVATPWVNYGLIATCVLVFLLQTSGGDQQFLAALYGYGFIPSVLSGANQLPPEVAAVPSIATLVTSQFLHGDWFHLAFNMLFLFVFGDNIEDALGHVRYLVFYLLCGVLAALAHFAFNFASEVPTVGASGAISGVLGAYLLLYPRAWVLVPLGFIPIMIPAALMLGGWFLFQIFSVVDAAGTNVAWWAHIGGFVAGLALVARFKRAVVPLYGGRQPPKHLQLNRDGVWQRATARRRRNGNGRGGDDRGKGPWS
jgi:membrane associated rhomboid family serine protease